MGERDFLLMPAGEAQDLVLCFPQRVTGVLVFHLMDAAGGVSLVPTQVRAFSTADVLVQLRCESLHCPTEGFISHLLGTAGCAGPSMGFCTLPSGELPLGFCLPQGTGVLRVFNHFLRCDELCEQTLCAWEKLLLTFAPLTFHHRCKVEISSKVNVGQ